MTAPFDHGGAAFPTLDHNGHSLVCREFGMSLRDWFAGQALAGLCANKPWQAAASWKELSVREAMAVEAVLSADALIAALKRGPQ